jgi:hypothetical protein
MTLMAALVVPVHAARTKTKTLKSRFESRRQNPKHIEIPSTGFNGTIDSPGASSQIDGPLRKLVGVLPTGAWPID